jgi:homoserine kinase
MATSPNCSGLPALQVRIPCSTSNLGPGFDLLGLALSLWLDVRVSPRENTPGAEHELEFVGPFADLWPREQNLLTRSFDAVFTAHNMPAPPCRFRVESEIPVARGLGSSGAAVAAGLALANHYLAHQRGTSPGPITNATHNLGIELEGHPDNVTASLFGGCTLCLPAGVSGGERHESGLVHASLSPELGFGVAWSDSTLTTSEARDCLPATVPFADAVENPRRLAMLLEGLRCADPHLLNLGQADRLHHRFRLALIPGGAAALEAAERAGAWLVAINGSGSSLLAIGPKNKTEQLAGIMASELARHASGAVGYSLDAVLGGPLVTEHPAASSRS